jgi:hypothetical protein
MGKFKLKKLSDVEGKERYCVKISNRFAALRGMLIKLGKLLQRI